MLKNKTILIMGIRNKWSIAFGIAKSAYENGAKLIFTYMGEENKEKIEDLISEFKGSKAYVLDGASEDELVRNVFTKIKKENGKIDGLVHAIAHANTEDLHNDLLYYYLNVFIFNSEKSQLIITSQETTLLSQDLINENRGVVWFVEKNKETASSEYSRGDSFGLHKNLSLYNSYRIGRLGAKPELGSIFINLED